MLGAVLLVVALALSGCTPPGLAYKMQADVAVEDPQFVRVMGRLLGPGLLEGNSVTTLENGDEIFPAMLHGIRAARRSITFQTFVYWSGTMGQQFADALAERAAAGVRVHVLIDAIGGARIDHAYVKEMEDAGAELCFYHALELPRIRSARTVNNRTHRKLLIIDGMVGFTGGVGIADEWMGHAQDPDHWRDNHYRVEGPVVAELQSAFLDTWMEATGEVLQSEEYFPALKRTGELRAQMFMSSYRGGSESMHLMYLLSIAAARKEIRLASAYFVPDALTTRWLVEARERGVSVRVIVPGPYIDKSIVREASRARWGDLLKAGVEIYEYQPTMYHCKQMIVDGLWTSIGSSNLDDRSFRLNDEANLNVLNAGFAEQQSRLFDDDLSHSRRITYEEWRRRPLMERVTEGLASLLGPQL